MALMECRFFSESLKQGQNFRLIMPEKYTTPALQPPYPVLYLLHGLSDDYTAWTRYTSLERYAWGKNLVIVMPDAGRSFYKNMVRGPLYGQYISEELPDFIQKHFCVSHDRKDTFVAGLSMGGYGAFRLAFKHPSRYAAAASLSGALDLVDYLPVCKESEACKEEWSNIFGDLNRLAGSDDDLLALMKRCAEKERQVPRLYASCGKEDILFSQNLRFSQKARDMGLSLTFEEKQGKHDWHYWDNQLPRLFEWLGF